jgi:hypothetical protein
MDLSNLTFQKNREDFTEKTSVTQPRKGLEGRGAFFAPPGAKNGAKRSLQSAASCIGFPAGAHSQIRFADLLL